MKCLKVSSRFDLPYNLTKYNPDCLISIKDVNYKFPAVATDFKGPKLLLSFEDILNGDDNDLSAPNKKHICDIIQFAINNKGKTFVANCTAGISRSSAASFIAEVVSEMKDPHTVLFNLLNKNEDIFPNNRMLKIAMQLTHIDFFTPFIDFQHIMQDRFLKRIDDRLGE